MAENFEGALEDHQRGEEAMQRKFHEGRRGTLSELAAPAPVSPFENRRMSLEFRQLRARARSSETSGDGRNAFLSELQAPAPIGHHPDSQLESLTPPSEEDEDQDIAIESASDLAVAPIKEEDDTQNELPPESEKPPKPPKPPIEGLPDPILADIYTLGYLVFFSMLGTLARLGIEAITGYPNAPFVSPVIWANLSGSLFMGFLAEDRRLFREEWTGTEGPPNSFLRRFSRASRVDSGISADPRRRSSSHGRVKKTIPLFIGLATGFCGSFTSFSSFMRDVFLALTNDLPSPAPAYPHPADTSTPRNGGYSFMASAGVLIIQTSVSMSAFKVGAHIAIVLEPMTPSIHFKFVRKYLNPIIVVCGFGCWLGAIFLSIWPPKEFWRPRATFSLVFAPLGCLTRYYASKYLNARIPAFPLGTFLSNIFGTAILAMCYDLEHLPGVGASNYVSCAVLEGVIEGYCGCASTVSTWIVELNALRRKNGWIYGSISVAVALSFLSVIMGSLGWTRGFSSAVCLG